MKRSLSLALACALAACGGSDAGTAAGAASGNPPPTMTPTDIPFTTVDRRNTSGVTSPETVVVSSAADWRALWSRHVSTLLPPPAAPEIDFGKVQLLGVFLGPRPNGCYGVEILKVSSDGSVRTVSYRATVPPPDAICTQQIVTPAHLVQVPASALPVVFSGS